MSKFFRLTSAAALTGSLFFGATAAVISAPSTLAAQVTCWVCVCDGSQCACQQVDCPKHDN